MSLPKTYLKNFHDEASVKEMEYKQLGNTDLLVSKVSLGGGTFSHLYGNLDEGEAIKTVEIALKKGINYIDTAPYYGQGESEKFLGKVLKNIPREVYYIATKVGRYELDIQKQFDFSAKKTKWHVDNSLKLLGLDYVDIIQIHDIEFAPSLDIVLNETLPALEEAKKLGKARYIGVTGYPLEILKKAVLGAPGRFDVVLSYARYTLIDESLKDYMAFFKDQKLGVICAAIHAMGLLTNPGPQSWHPSHEHVKEVVKEAREFCIANNVELGKLAVCHALEYDQPSTFLIGMQTQELLNMNLSAHFDGVSPKEREVLQVILEKYFSKIKNCHWEGVELEQYKKNTQKS